MLTMLPDFCRSICFTASCDTYRKPASVVETRVLKSSVVYSVKGFGIKTPALLTSTSIRPNRDTAVSHNLCGRARVADVPINECNIRGR